MRCHQTGTVFKMDTRLAHMLYQTARHYEGRRLEVVSGYRHPKVARNPKSPHKKGLACDFRVPGVPNAALRDWLRKTFDHAGVGYYPNSVFVHLDNRKTGPSAFWIDYAGPGQEASYSENPREDLRSGRAERARVGGDEAQGELRAQTIWRSQERPLPESSHRAMACNRMCRPSGRSRSRQPRTHSAIERCGSLARGASVCEP